eukprot:CAMPEP_0185272910 /NCGR_PEP_ID=MMETSP1359-20130426/48390_1 /TAXON_ID=552665 /ORGANISM="Bigelowiella longifila, Strain CCMP242" /LENGTH=113 /DNA_ID=CAMNT_0027865377 /DNA_START=1 /DNA_END=339 /DNA_ORIENTATION=+
MALSSSLPVPAPTSSSSFSSSTLRKHQVAREEEAEEKEKDHGVSCPSLAESDEEVDAICKRLVKIAFNRTAGYTENSYAVHHWMCSWCRGIKGENFVSLEDVIPISARRRPVW